ncbi:MAG: hypothetical protein HCAMLNBO_01236 [Candidatus Brocadia fulgida]|nr:hypothetical protein [Candidatus Brocadia fulgida]
MIYQRLTSETASVGSKPHFSGRNLKDLSTIGRCVLKVGINKDCIPKMGALQVGVMQAVAAEIAVFQSDTTEDGNSVWIRFSPGIPCIPCLA